MAEKNQIMVSSSMSEKLAIEARIFAAQRNISRAELIRQALELIMSIEKTENETETTLPSSNQ